MNIAEAKRNKVALDFNHWELNRCNLPEVVAPVLGRLARKKFDASAKAAMKERDPEAVVTVVVSKDGAAEIHRGLAAMIEYDAEVLSDEDKAWRPEFIVAESRLNMLNDMEDMLAPLAAIIKQ